MAQKTNAVRQLDQNKIPYELRNYTVDESDLSAGTVAAKINFPLPQVYKTLVARGDKTGVLLACIPGDKELDLKALASLSGNKKAEVVPLKDVQPLTGYIRGGVSPLGLKKKYPFFLEEIALSFGTISISAGVRGCQVLLNPQHLVSLTRAICGSISKDA
ncbi:Cys-tRNA(Pro)/Cys-tRNA(Cys) deacylase [Aneurinibacillus soli]|uniref:Cys-tRNA(Pro)/Cys-tRNA(Cys) deacylase n=1 Tax=Aneurinibacillus soli TaxID=1500254 RepID=A0A0U5AZL1_9BACL|nr:Cys-tRNA(Pro) deacylase [Aneurinibacillus soli]PYE60128.1 Cys-tRNA(Pro)/Cys-tRNA(Cys) deacylase [Aneurinibacillus soli]BAU26383.1 Cys-tRNA(Pro)/Cys-tRNA(Cys) deacylase YbaK [Aneurinibacillus soli]